MLSLLHIKWSIEIDKKQYSALFISFKIFTGKRLKLKPDDNFKVQFTSHVRFRIRFLTVEPIALTGKQQCSALLMQHQQYKILEKTLVGVFQADTKLLHFCFS